jgi:Tfp pilus assembly protein PilF
MNTFCRGIISSEITFLCDSERRIGVLITAEEKALAAQPDSIENSTHSASSRVALATLKFARDDVQKAIRNLKTALDSENVEHIDIGSAPCSP